MKKETHKESRAERQKTRNQYFFLAKGMLQERIARGGGLVGSFSGGVVELPGGERCRKG